MIFVIGRDLTVTREPKDEPPLEAPALEITVGPAEISAVNDRFPDGVGLDYWSFRTPGGRVDLRPTETDVALLYASDVAALPWLYQLLFQTPKAFAAVAVRAGIGIADVIRAYADYLAL